MENFCQETVRDNMASPAETVAPEMTVGDLLRLFSSNEFDSYPVVREGQMVGVVSRADSIKPFAIKPASALEFDKIMGTTVAEIMSSQVITVGPDAMLEQVVQLMTTLDFESFPVIDNENRVTGIIAREDVIRALARCGSRSSLPLPLHPLGYAIA